MKHFETFEGYINKSPIELNVSHITYDGTTEYPNDTLTGVGGLEYLDSLGRAGSSVSCEGIAKRGRKTVTFHFYSDGPNSINDLEVDGKAIKYEDVEDAILSS